MEEAGEEMSVSVTPKAAIAAASGFAHLLPLTPEVWTASLPHRTQVVYTPDYSYILQRLRVRPGSVLIEAGAGSGSFTHAAARAVFNGYPFVEDSKTSTKKQIRKRQGKVWSYEFHEQRVQKLRTEIDEHGLRGIVEITHQDVCQEGFGREFGEISDRGADAVFLDLPAPWLALKHLTRAKSVRVASNKVEISKGQGLGKPLAMENGVSKPQSVLATQQLLNPSSPIYLCTFSPCIEQVQRTVATMQQMGWLEIEMVEIAAKRIEVRRDRIGLHQEGVRGAQVSPVTVDEAVARLREVEGRSRAFHKRGSEVQEEAQGTDFVSQSSEPRIQQNITRAQEARKLYKEGRLIHRAEPELKTHTSYLVFAILPREWTTEDELLAQKNWPLNAAISERDGANMSKRQKKMVAKAKAGGNKAFEMQQGKESGNLSSSSL